MAPRRPPPTHRATPSAVQTRQKTKKVVSTSGLFAQIPKLKAAKSSKHVSMLKQPETRRMVAVVIPKKRAEHPLMDKFNDTTTFYATDLLSSASSKLFSTRDTLIKRLEAATPETLLDPSIRNLRASLCKPLQPPATITSLRSSIEREQQILSSLQKEYDALTSSIDSLVEEIVQIPSQSNASSEGEKKVQSERVRMHRVMVARTAELAREISVLGAEEVREMEEEDKAEAKTRERITKFFAGLDGDGDGDRDESEDQDED
ncbi:hypothetical protein FKW77_003255 [Venturia effusa]|uniref:Uncharacterized protein n=1 Tax=Venturia effusa TaxID=50376 RepID=A0A517LLB2_9PEZI|nr:hypothetical protein FKW77_003255 [Venturia effusa]